MKVVSPQQMSQLESNAYRDGASESDFMEEAGNGVALVVHDHVEKYQLDRRVVLLCGKGNNAGDAYVAGLQLLHLDYEVMAYQLFPVSECSNLCKQNQFAFANEGGHIYEVSSDKEINLPNKGIIIDGIFGTGFRGKVQEPIASIIRKANESGLPIVAVDIPSGLDGKSGKVAGIAIVATTTAFLGLPKTGFFLREGWDHVGVLSYVNFGLNSEYIESAKADLIMLSPDMMQPLLPPIIRSRHKYQAGHVVGLAGSPQMPGAALLSSLSALCSGAGIVHLLYPKGMENGLLSMPYELLRVPYDQQNLEPVLELMNHASATFIGPGLGRTPEVAAMLSWLLPKLEKPCVLDADALFFLSQEKKIKLPKKTVITPHHGEMARLLQVPSIELTPEGLKQCADYAKEKQVTLVLKGGPTFILNGNNSIQVNPTGDPGMATAGSGDVLTGVIASLLAQGLGTAEAASLGAYLHGISGEIAADALTSYCMTASDIIAYLPDAFRPTQWSL